MPYWTMHLMVLKRPFFYGLRMINPSYKRDEKKVNAMHLFLCMILKLQINIEKQKYAVVPLCSTYIFLFVIQSVSPKQRRKKPFPSIFPAYTQWFGGASASLKACAFFVVFLFFLLEVNLMTYHLTHVLLEQKFVGKQKESKTRFLHFLYIINTCNA